MKIAILLSFSIISCFVVGDLGAAVSTRAPPRSNGNGMSRGATPPRKPKQVQNHPQPQPRVQRSGRPAAVQRTTTPHSANAKRQNPNPARRNARGVVRGRNSKQRVDPNVNKRGGISPRQIPGIPAGPPDSDIDDKVVIDDPNMSTRPTIIPPIDISPTAPQQNTDETDEPETTLPPQTTTTIEPQTTTTIAPQTTTTIAPQTTTTIAPQTTTTIAPQTTTTIAPQTTTTIAPQTTTTIRPQCIPVPPVKTAVIYVPQPVVRQGYFERPPPVKKPPPVVVVNNEISPGIPCPAPSAVGVQAVQRGVQAVQRGVQTAHSAARPVTSYGQNMVVINNPKGVQKLPAMIYNNGRPPPILTPTG